jgi:succinate dehydrogenase/fumarate reductase flavoprotein subunit
MAESNKASAAETTDCDVVVIGSGAGGLAAALTARLKGLDVVVVEKAPVLGGTLALSGGGLWIPSSPMAQAAGIEDSREAALTYFKSCAGEYFDAARANAYLDNAPRMVKFFEENTLIRFWVDMTSPDHHPECPGAINGGRTIFGTPVNGRILGGEIKKLRPPKSEMTFMGIMIKPGAELMHFLNVFRSVESTKVVAKRLLQHFRDMLLYGRSMHLANGNALAARALKSAIDLKIPMHSSTTAVRLLQSNGGVSGVECSTPAGLRRFIARRGVVLATGGIAHDAARKAQLYKHVMRGGPHYSPVLDTNTGDGIRMAEQINAKFSSALSNPAGWVPMSIIPSRNPTPRTFSHVIDRPKPGFIAVTRHGVRFANEANSYHTFGKAMIKACSGEVETSCYLIADHDTIRRYGMGSVIRSPVPLGAKVRSGYLLRGKTLEELARKAGIDVTAFVDTVAEYNRHAVNGKDPQFGRGESFYNRALGDPDHQPNPCVAPVLRAPFYAMKLYVGDSGTFAGLATDERARVLDTQGQVIPRLYAAGNDMCSVFGGDYLGGGSTLGPAFTFGYIAGCQLAEETSIREKLTAGAA